MKDALYVPDFSLKPTLDLSSLPLSFEEASGATARLADLERRILREKKLTEILLKALGTAIRMLSIEDTGARVDEDACRLTSIYEQLRNLSMGKVADPTLGHAA